MSAFWKESQSNEFAMAWPTSVSFSRFFLVKCQVSTVNFPLEDFFTSLKGCDITDE